MEGWGCGEWSELKGGAPKVVSVHNAHVNKLWPGYLFLAFGFFGGFGWNLGDCKTWN